MGMLGAWIVSNVLFVLGFGGFLSVLTYYIEREWKSALVVFIVIAIIINILFLIAIGMFSFLSWAMQF